MPTWGRAQAGPPRAAGALPPSRSAVMPLDVPHTGAGWPLIRCTRGSAARRPRRGTCAPEHRRTWAAGPCAGAAPTGRCGARAARRRAAGVAVVSVGRARAARQGHAWPEDKEHCEEYARMLSPSVPLSYPDHNPGTAGLCVGRGQGALRGVRAHAGRRPHQGQHARQEARPAAGAPPPPRVARRPLTAADARRAAACAAAGLGAASSVH